MHLELPRWRKEAGIEPPETSLAIPPLYLLRTATHCPECREATHVYTLGCAGFHEAESFEPINAFFFLRQICSVPSSVLRAFKRECSGYYLDRARTASRPT